MSSEEKEKELQDKERAEKLKKRRDIAEIKYLQEKENIKKKAQTSFGSLILSDELSAPLYSFPCEKKFSKGIMSMNIVTPGPDYEFENKYKYQNVRIFTLASKLEIWIRK